MFNQYWRLVNGARGGVGSRAGKGRSMRRRLWLVLVLILPTSVAIAQSAREADETFFELKVRPILAGRCFTCHGGKKTSQGLRVDSRQALLKGGERGPALVPGRP